jgi:regulation of enolase protein 1 (concanavalin A-like superfamily)
MAPGASGTRATVAPAGNGARPRPGGPSPALAKLPPNIYASPAFVAGGAAVVVLYGLFLSAVVTNYRKHHRDVASSETTVASLHGGSAPSPEPARSHETEPSPTPEPKPKQGEPNPTKAPAPEPPAPKPEPPAPSKSVEAPATKPSPAEAPKPTPTRSREPAVALSNSVKKEPAVPTIGGIGVWVDPDNDCEKGTEGDAVTISVPGGMHVNSSELGKANAPRIMTEVNGDFVVQVRVDGRIQPGSQPLADLPLAFQGAGLLVWQDEENYLRFERAARSSPEKPLVHELLLESRRDGKAGLPAYRSMRDRPITLRIERRGSDFACSYNIDGKTWVPLKQSSLRFANKVSVGVSASNLSPKSFSVRFEDFSLEAAGKKAAASRK